MTLTSVKPRDLVQVGGALGHVQAKEPGKLLVRWHGRTCERWVKAREVEGHWARRR